MFLQYGIKKQLIVQSFPIPFHPLIYHLCPKLIKININIIYRENLVSF